MNNLFKKKSKKEKDKKDVSKWYDGQGEDNQNVETSAQHNRYTAPPSGPSRNAGHLLSSTASLFIGGVGGVATKSNGFPMIVNHRKVKVDGLDVENTVVDLPSRFVINTLEAGIAQIGLNITEPYGQNIDCDTTETQKGIHQCCFTPTSVGEHSISVCFGGMNIPGSPFKVNVCATDTLPEVKPEPISSKPSVNYKNLTEHAEVSTDSYDIIVNISSDVKTRLGSQLKEAIEDLEIGNKIGKGQFGAVYEVRYTEEGKGTVIAAAKTLKSSKTTPQQKEEFFKEAALMKYFNHNNVLELFAVTVHQGNPFILTPLMKHGNLKSYLQKNQQTIEVETLLDFGLQVASGMEYVSSLRFVHRDLAARNCLVNEDMVVKISDFGMARDNFKGNYVMVTMKQMPLRWMAPEIFDTWTFTTETDVWAYAVLLWEILTCGGEPYEELDDQYLRASLASGERLSKPKRASEEVYHLMLRCWLLDQEERPTFQEIKQTMEHDTRKGKRNTDFTYRHN